MDIIQDVNSEAKHLLINTSLGRTSAEISPVSGVRSYSHAFSAVKVGIETFSVSLTCELQK